MQQSRGKLKVSNVEFEGRYTLGNKLQRHVAATNRTCVLKNFCENLCLSNRILLLQPDQTKFVRLVAATKFFCRNKAFLKYFPVHTKGFVAVTRRATYRPNCTPVVICHRDVLQQLLKLSL